MVCAGPHNAAGPNPDGHGPGELFGRPAAASGPSRQAFKVTLGQARYKLGQARRVSDDCIFMLNGEMVENGATADLFERPRRRETAMYVSGRYG